MCVSVFVHLRGLECVFVHVCICCLFVCATYLCVYVVLHVCVGNCSGPNAMPCVCLHVWSIMCVYLYVCANVGATCVLLCVLVYIK